MVSSNTISLGVEWALHVSASRSLRAGLLATSQSRLIGTQFGYDRCWPVREASRVLDTLAVVFSATSTATTQVHRTAHSPHIHTPCLHTPTLSSSLRSSVCRSTIRSGTLLRSAYSFIDGAT